MGGEREGGRGKGMDIQKRKEREEEGKEGSPQLLVHTSMFEILKKYPRT